MTDPGKFKELPITSWAVNHGTSVLILFFIITFAGVLAYRSIPKESFPEIEIPRIAVNTIYPGVSPRDMESLVTQEIEDEINGLWEFRRQVMRTIPKGTATNPSKTSYGIARLAEDTIPQMAGMIGLATGNFTGLAVAGGAKVVKGLTRARKAVSSTASLRLPPARSVPLFAAITGGAAALDDGSWAELIK